MTHERIWRDAVAPKIAKGAALMFAHGFSVHYGRVTPPDTIDVVLVAPKGPGDLVRREYVSGRGVPCLYAVHRNASGKAKERALGYANAISRGAGGTIETTFAEETETDLFGEQSVLCGGVTELVVAGYETLVAAGYQPEVAYFECLHELKLIVDLLHEGGLKKMHDYVSETAKYGDLVSGPRVVNAETRSRMREILSEIRSGQFARAWIQENETGRPQYETLLQKDLSHPIESVGRKLRARMPWLNAGNA
jgi:ketol-acid reductoisomerase